MMHRIWSIIVMVSFICACQKNSRKEKAVQLYKQYCAACHIAPKMEQLPKHIWEENVLPDMLARMKIKEQYDDGVSDRFRPEIALNDWVLLQSYIVEMAPEKLENIKLQQAPTQQQFEEVPMALDDKNGSNITYLSASDDAKLIYGTLEGELSEYDMRQKEVKTFYTGSSPITWFAEKDNEQYFVEVGILDPSQNVEGSLTKLIDGENEWLPMALHRPVHLLVHDLNNNGIHELVVSEFGDETGQLSLISKSKNDEYTRTSLLNLPGCVRTIAKDMNEDGKTDLVVMTTQGNESITILYQNNDLSFTAKKVIEFSPVYGSSWFEMFDYNGDGYEDIVTVNGDNADKSYIGKPYHGMRIHLNDGKNNFEESFFYPMYGATRVVANDFDGDGDVDFGLISCFPDYESAPERSFVYLENSNPETFEFVTFTLNNPFEGRWFLMDAADVDQDGDVDLVLGSLTYAFTPVPERFSKQWKTSKNDILVLKNKLK